MGVNKGQRIKFKDRAAAYDIKDREMEPSRFVQFCSDFKISSRLVANEVYRQVMTAMLYYNLEEDGTIRHCMNYSGFLHCLGVLTEEKAKHAVSTEGTDTPAGKAYNLLESMAVTKGVSIVEKASIPLKNLQKVVKKILEDGEAYRTLQNKQAESSSQNDQGALNWKFQAATGDSLAVQEYPISPSSQLESVDEAVEAARQRIVEWNYKHYSKLPAAAAHMVTSVVVEAEGEDGHREPVHSRESVAEALEEHPEVFQSAMQELAFRQKEAAFYGHLREALEMSDAMQQLKADVNAARHQRVDREHCEAMEELHAGMQQHSEELARVWELRQQESEAELAEQMWALKNRQQEQCVELQAEIDQLAENAPKAKPPGMSESIWAQITEIRKLRPSAELLDIDTKYRKAMNARLFELAEQLKREYENKAMGEWKQHMEQEQKSAERKFHQLETTQRQEIKSLQLRQQIARGESVSMRNKEFEALEAFYRKKFEELRRISMRSSKTQGGGALPEAKYSPATAQRATATLPHNTLLSIEAQTHFS